jgi:hypothetical protein
MDAFTYSALKNAWMNDDRIGRWSGCPVYAVGRAAMGDECVNGVYYVVFDDGNKLVKLNGSGEFILHGYITESGHVEEYNYKMRYISPKEEREAAEARAATEAEREAKETAAAEADYEEIIGDVQLGDLVAKTLETARTMTIDSLLEGYEYGLT